MSERDAPPNVLRLGAWALFFLVLAIWSGQYVVRCGSHRDLVARPAPPFEGVIAAGDGAGDRVSLETLRGQPVMLDFWASWCQPCRASIPILSRLAARHAADGLVTLGVNVEQERPVRHVIRAHAAIAAGFPTLHDQGWRMQSAYGVETIPTLVLIDRRGMVRTVRVGVPSESDLDVEIREILGERP